MYIVALIVLLMVSYFITRWGIIKKNRLFLSSGIALGVLTLLFYWFMGFWGEKLWFDSLGYTSRFWKLWFMKVILFIAGFITGGLYVLLLSLGLPRGDKIKMYALLSGAIVNALYWETKWDVVFKFLNKHTTEIREPILGNNTGFYFFSLPFYNSLFYALLILTIIALIWTIVFYGRNYEQNDFFIPVRRSGRRLRLKALYINAGALFIILAFGTYLKRFNLLYSEYGVVSGPGWTDAHVRLPLLMVNCILFLLFGISLLIPAVRHKISMVLSTRNSRSKITAMAIAGGTMIGLWFLLLVITPFLFQKLKVVPNEISLEKTFIENNIRFTRLAYDLKKVEEQQYPAEEGFSRKLAEKNEKLLSNIRLWDYRALDAVFKQFQEIRLYYEFADVDVDRYHFSNEYRQVMVSAREMEQANLPQQSQTFVNKAFKYTHGYGITLTPVNEFTPSGLPNLLVKNIPPVSAYPELKVTRPEIYYGELTRQYVVVNSEEQEFDYPSGEANVYKHYEGEGGVAFKDGYFWRKLIYGWKFGGTRFLFSGYPAKQSRVMFHREIKERVNTLAPFLQFDDDPYIVLSEGQLYWIIDAYTTSDDYPYSEPFTFSWLSGQIPGTNTNQERMYDPLSDRYRGINYIRNSVKIVVNAYNGKVDFYIFEKEDPIINVYRSIFPKMFRDKSEMPAGLRAHIRYPADLLLIQGLVYAKYHMTDPAVFYNQEDLWVQATEKYYGSVQPVEPYYIMWEPKGADSLEFILMKPFTPKNKQVLIGWLAGMCDGENYGRLLAYKFPKEKRVLGTQQFETKIDQNSFLSGQLTLWDQRGSRVIRGNVLVIPIGNTILYVEPIYLKSETAAYPELRLVTVMHNDRLSYAESFSQALEGLFSEAPAVKVPDTTESPAVADIDQLIRQAEKAFQDYINYTSNKQFPEAGRALNELQQALERLSEKKQQ